MEKDKIQSLKEVIKSKIETIPGSLTDKASFLEMNKGDVSKLLRLKVVPSVEKLVHLEKKFAVTIINLDFGISSPYPKQSYEPNLSLSESIKQKFGRQYEKLIEDLNTSFEKISEETGLSLRIRERQYYVSLNLVPKNKKVGGFHLVNFRYSTREELLKIHFIVPDLMFEVEKAKYALSPGKLETTFLPYKNSGKNDLFDGQPFLSIPTSSPENLSDLKIEQICLLAHRVFQIQSLGAFKRF
jgi:transcriptional regulator with XRE-family HTH domain